MTEQLKTAHEVLARINHGLEQLKDDRPSPEDLEEVKQAIDALDLILQGEVIASPEAYQAAEAVQDILKQLLACQGDMSTISFTTACTLIGMLELLDTFSLGGTEMEF